jgi:hypothetical protein
VDVDVALVGALRDVGDRVAIVVVLGAAVGDHHDHPADRRRRGALDGGLDLAQVLDGAVERLDQLRLLDLLAVGDQAVELADRGRHLGRLGQRDVAAVPDDADLGVRQGRERLEHLGADRVLEALQRLLVVRGVENEDDRGLDVGAAVHAGQVRHLLEPGAALDGPRRRIAADRQHRARVLEIDRADEQAQPHQLVQHRRRRLDVVQRHPAHAGRALGGLRGRCRRERQHDRDRGEDADHLRGRYYRRKRCVTGTQPSRSIACVS